jgi:hypothetical protein
VVREGAIAGLDMAELAAIARSAVKGMIARAEAA